LLKKGGRVVNYHNLILKMTSNNRELPLKRENSEELALH